MIMKTNLPLINIRLFYTTKPEHKAVEIIKALWFHRIAEDLFPVK